MADEHSQIGIGDTATCGSSTAARGDLSSTFSFYAGNQGKCLRYLALRQSSSVEGDRVK
jgi:hypothetical protein